MYARYYISSFGYISHTFFLETFILNHIKMYSDRKASPILYVSPFPNLVLGAEIFSLPLFGALLTKRPFCTHLKAALLQWCVKCINTHNAGGPRKQSYPSHVIFWIENHDLYSLSCQEASFWKGKKNHTLIKSHI